MSELAIQNQNLSLEQRFGYTEKQMEFIKGKICENASHEELEQFFYRCSVLKLDPLMPGQIYFLKFKKRNPKPGEDAFHPASIVLGIDGFRMLASRSGKHSGTKRGVVRNQKGECIGGWADVYRSDWTQPAHLEVSLKEYMDPWKETWKNMPESMIQKVAEVGALRMAFPETLQGVYSQDEMDQAQRRERVVESTIESSSKSQDSAPPLDKSPSQAQLARLFAIAKSNGFTNADIREILKVDYGIESSKDLTLKAYDELCENLQAKTIQPQKKPSEPKEFTDGDQKEPKINSPKLPWEKYLDDPKMVK